MALAWRSILSRGSRAMNDGNRNESLNFNLTVAPSQNAAALLMISSLSVDYENSFLTMNMTNPHVLGDMTHASAKDQDFYVSSIFRSGEYWTAQTHRINPGILVSGSNTLRIHARAENGTPFSNIDDFRIARVFVLYTKG